MAKIARRKKIEKLPLWVKCPHCEEILYIKDLLKQKTRRK